MTAGVPLPQPATARWRPLRLGLVEVYHYDSEEFWFDHGHLLLRGNNGTGKSKVLSLTLPFLLDASLSPTRIEPDADRGKRMEWNLLMGGHFDRRTGYVWIEFGRIEDGEPHYLTLGCGLRAVAGRGSVDSWFFVTELRIGEDLALISDQRTALTRERLAEIVGSHAVFTTARDYRRRVDERLFGLGSERYRALIDTLIQLRQPQLSKQPNEQNLSDALSQAFPPLETVLLEDVADAMTQLDEYRDELDDYRSMHQAVAQFNQTYGRYARILARRRARDLRQAQTACDNASTQARQAQEAFTAAEQAVADRENELEGVRTRLSEVGGQIEALKASPEMRSAQELHRAQSEAAQAREQAGIAANDYQRAQSRHEQERAGMERRAEAGGLTRDGLTVAKDTLETHAQAAGIETAHRVTWGEQTAPDAIGHTDAETRAAITTAQDHLARQRARQIAQIRKRLDAADTARHAHDRAQSERDARYADSEAAETSAGEGRQALQATAARYIHAWRAFIEQARTMLPADWPDAEECLADWVTSLEGAAPLDRITDDADHRQRAELAEAASELRQQQTNTERELGPLRTERDALAEGRQPEPPAPLTRVTDRDNRAGAPLWQLIDFAANVSDDNRAGIEAALQASGVLDAWVSPAGELLHPDTQDTWLMVRPRQPRNLGELLHVGIDPGNARTQALDAERIRDVLSGIALGDNDAGEGGTAEYWVTTDGRYRIGPGCGAWSKPRAEYIGFAAREAARRRRLEALEREIDALQHRLDEIAVGQTALNEQREALDYLLRQRPDSDALRQAHARLAAAEHTAGQARARLAEAETHLQSARGTLGRAREDLELDARDARLPVERGELEAVQHALNEYRHGIVIVRAAIHAHAQALAELTEQSTREQAARDDRDKARLRAAQQQTRMEQIQSRYDELKRSVGASVEQVLARLSCLEADQTRLNAERTDKQKDFDDAREERGGARQKAEDCEQRQQERFQERGSAVVQFQAFAETGLLQAAVPALQLPDGAREWNVDPALNAARATEQSLQSVADSEADWKRVQDRLSSEFTELQRAMSARGYRSSGEPGDHGFVVRVVFNQNHEAPDRLQALLESEIAERRNLLTAKEREIIENHLQAEVAAQLQQLMRDADERVQRINTELEHRPTSTGVKFKLVWEARDDSDGAELVGLADVRKRLLNTVSDAWSPADRDAVGGFLQQRIATERERDDGAARIDQLARALDYRAWHQFRVRRWQDGKWRPLSGPASSGERALGLTVPLFAAASSHYESAADFSPRLVLLDEAFAGIDDAARAHCMDLIREFDLDFVMTSEREWGCYAELPGVSICHLVRREGVDAVYVSRWKWNGRSREPAAEPAHALAAQDTDATTISA